MPSLTLRDLLLHPCDAGSQSVPGHSSFLSMGVPTLRPLAGAVLQLKCSSLAFPVIRLPYFLVVQISPSQEVSPEPPYLGCYCILPLLPQLTSHPPYPALVFPIKLRHSRLCN